MKIFALLLSIVALVSSAVALKHSACGAQYAKDGDETFSCLGYFPSWSYNRQTNECTQFTYGGCGGSENRFLSLNECERVCKE